MARDRLGWDASDYEALVAMARAQGRPAGDFAAVMMSESSMRAAARNPSGAQGLIQFAGLGFDITGFSPARQMPYIAQYYSPWRPAGGWKNRAQIYQANYLPATIRTKGSDDDAILSVRGDGNYQGPIFDKTNKGYTTVRDLELRLQDVTATTADLRQLGITNAGRIGQARDWEAAIAGIRAAGGDVGGSEAPSIAKIVVGGLLLGAALTYAYPRVAPVFARPVRRLRAA